MVWGGGIDGAGYSSALATTMSGHEQILIFNSKNANAHDPSNGYVLWSYPWRNGYPHVAVPFVISSNRVLFSSGYGYGSEMLEISNDGSGRQIAKQVWKTSKLKAKFANLVLHKGHIYGLDDGIMTCLDVETGEQKWKDGRYGHGQIILTGDLLVLIAESGHVVMIEPTPDKLREITKFRALNGKTWNPHALAGNLLLVRNDQEAAAFRLPLNSTK